MKCRKMCTTKKRRTREWCEFERNPLSIPHITIRTKSKKRNSKNQRKRGFLRSVTKVIDYYNIFVGAIVTLLSALFGTFWYIFVAYLILNVFDWLTGWYKSRKLKKESSAIGLMGIIKKLGYWVIIAVAFLLSGVFVHMGNDLLGIDLSFLTLLGWFTLACLMVNEVRSIIENLVECGYNVPKVLVSGLAVTEKLLNKQIDSEED